MIEVTREEFYELVQDDRRQGAVFTYELEDVCWRGNCWHTHGFAQTTAEGKLKHLVDFDEEEWSRFGVRPPNELVALRPDGSEFSVEVWRPPFLSLPFKQNCSVFIEMLREVKEKGWVCLWEKDRCHFFTETDTTEGTITTSGMAWRSYVSARCRSDEERLRELRVEDNRFTLHYAEGLVSGPTDYVFSVYRRPTLGRGRLKPDDAAALLSREGLLLWHVLYKDWFFYHPEKQALFGSAYSIEHNDKRNAVWSLHEATRLETTQEGHLVLWHKEPHGYFREEFDLLVPVELIKLDAFKNC